MRRELVHQLIAKYKGTGSPLRIIDIGCGAGLLTKELEVYGPTIGIDPSEQAVTFTQSRGLSNVRLGSAEATGCAASEFDVVVCLDVLEHLREDEQGIQEVQRILKPGGVGIIFVPAFKFLWSVTDEVSHHYRRYRKSELEQKFSSAGFQILRSSYFNTILFPLIALIRVTVRFLHIRITSEAETGDGIVNKILYKIFGFERTLLKHTDFSFGVSIMYVIQKPFP